MLNMGFRKRNKASQFFTTIADIGSLLMAAVYFLYVALLLILDIGKSWLYYAMLVITILYFLFFVLKLALLNRVVKNKRTFRITRLTIKYSKWGMKLINALFVALSLANVTVSGNNAIALIGIFVVVFSFVVSILWDIGVWFTRRKLREIKIGWDSLTERQKKARIELVIGSIIKSLDSVTGLELAQTAEAYITKQVAATPKEKEPPVQPDKQKSGD